MQINLKDKRISDILNELNELDKLEESHIDKYIKEFEDIYAGQDFRHQYSEILRTLLQFNEENLEYLMVHLMIIHVEISKHPSENLIKSFNKLIDHIDLEMQRISLYRRYEQKELELNNKVKKATATLEDTYNRTQELSERSEELSEKFKDDLKSFDKKINDTQTNFISILGIFASIIFTLFGGLNILTEVFSQIKDLDNKINFWGIMIIGSFVVISIFNLLNLMLHAIGRYTEKNLINTNCSNICDPECQHKKDNSCNWVTKPFKKYTHISIINTLIIIWIMISIMFYFKCL